MPDLLREKGVCLTTLGGGCTGTTNPCCQHHNYRTSGATPCRGNPPPATPVPYAKVPPPIAPDVVRALVYDASCAQL